MPDFSYTSVKWFGNRFISRHQMSVLQFNFEPWPLEDVDIIRWDGWRARSCRTVSIWDDRCKCPVQLLPLLPASQLKISTISTLPLGLVDLLKWLTELREKGSPVYHEHVTKNTDSHRVGEQCEKCAGEEARTSWPCLGLPFSLSRLFHMLSSSETLCVVPFGLVAAVLQRHNWLNLCHWQLT